MTLTQLEYVVAVATHYHFGKAAKASFVTQPTLSLQIQKLEEELGQKIFNRSASPIKVTSFGRKIVEQAQVILRATKDLEFLARGEIEQVSGKIEVGVIPTIAPYLIPLFAKKFVKSYPQAQIFFHELQTEEIVSALQSEKIDLGIASTPLKIKGISERKLFLEPFIIYLSPNNDLLKKEMLTEKDLNPQKAWLLKEGHCLRNQLINFCQSQAISDHSNLHFEAGSMETLKSMVDENEGFTLFPQLAVNRFNEDDLSRTRTFKTLKPVREVSLIFSGSFSRINFLKALEEEILKILPENVEITSAEDTTIVPIV